MKKLVCMCMFLMMVMCLSGCDNDKKIAQTLLEGTIENSIKGKINKDYMEINGWDSRLGADNERSNIQCDMIHYLEAVYGYEAEPNESSRSVIMSFSDVYGEILENFEYTMSDLEKVGEGQYKATITYRPFALGDALDETAMKFYQETDEKIAEAQEEEIEELRKMSIAIESDPYLLNNHLFQVLSEEAKEFAKDIKYSEEVSVDVTIRLTGSFWTLSNSYYEEFLAGIMDLNVDEVMDSNVDEDIDLNIDETTDSEINEEE